MKVKQIQQYPEAYTIEVDGLKYNAFSNKLNTFFTIFSLNEYGSAVEVGTGFNTMKEVKIFVWKEWENKTFYTYVRNL